MLAVCIWLAGLRSYLHSTFLLTRSVAIRPFSGSPEQNKFAFYLVLAVGSEENYVKSLHGRGPVSLPEDYRH